MGVSVKKEHLHTQICVYSPKFAVYEKGMDIYMHILQMSLSASILIIFVAILRKFPTYYMSKHIVLIIWKIAFFRLLIPFTTSFNFLNITPVKESNIIIEVFTRAYVKNIPITNSNTANTINKNALHLTMPTSDYINPLFLIWIIGICISLLYFFISYIKISTIIKEALPIQDNDFTSEWLKKQNIKRTISIVTSDRISTPITFGIIRPKIVIPLNMNYQNKEQFSYVLTHELVHIEGFDAIWKVVSILTLCIHWFNPLVWMMYNLFNRDVEIACDEKVISIVGENQKSDYAMTLIHLAEQKSDFNGLYNSFAKNPIKERIVNIMKYKKIKCLVLELD